MPSRVVGIGASAGGLEAVSELLAALPAKTGTACIVVQHLDPRHESLLPEILAKTTAVPVELAVDAAVVRPDHVYVIPPNATLRVADRRLQLTKRSASEHHLPVDALFTSLAAAYAENAIGVVLSGSDSDGALGVQAIKHEGGIVFAQRPDLARFPNMPRHAIDSGCVDQVLSPRDIALEIARLGRHVSLSDATSGSDTSEHEALLKRVFHRLRAAHGLDFTHYKRNTLRRRLERRMALRGIENLEEYCSELESNAGEMAALYQDFLIRVTEFFRDSHSLEVLRRHVFPALRESRDPKQPIRVWVPGCATGEEVYSLAIELLEGINNGDSPLKVQIFGTDVSEAALEKARTGVYRTNVLQAVSEERLQRFFERHDDGFRVVKEVRDLCLFARQDVTHDPPFSRLDIVSCRNLLIYLDEVAQRRILQTFHFALRPQGILIIGPSESVGQSSELFEQLDKRYRIYRRRAGSGPSTSWQQAEATRASALHVAEGDRPIRVEAESLSREADRWLLARFAPASLLIDDALNIRQFRGRTGPFLEPASGPPSHDLRSVVRPELLAEMLPAIRQARETRLSVRRDGLRLDERDVSLEVVPMSVPSSVQSLLILLDDGSHPPRGVRQPPSLDGLPESEKDRRLAQQQREVETLRDYLRLAIEEHGAVQEELKSAHEEMLSANEEYQSTNEELESSKEELQSTNEELITTVEELRNRNRDLAVVNTELEQARLVSERALAYADVIIETVRTPLAVIDAELRITRVNRAFLADLEIPREHIEGLLVGGADGSPWNTPGLRQKLIAVIRDGEPLDDWEVTLNLPVRGRRVVTLSARRILGDRERAHRGLLAFDDVTDRAGVAADLLANNQRKDEFLALLAHELRHPLTPIGHAIHLLRLADRDPATAELHETIDVQTRRLVRFVNELIDLVRINRDLLEITPERLDLLDIVQQAAASIQPLVQEHGLTLTLALARGPVVVDGDAGRLNQVVTNLLENAVKYTKEGGHITLTLEQQGAEARLSVRDTGVGIAPEIRARIFEPFTRADTETARSSGGLGLGLSVVRRVVGLHGGRVEAHSAGREAGSEFVVWLPAIIPRREAPAPRQEKPTRTSTEGATVRRKVLLVDDRQEVTASLTRLIRAFGHEVAVAGDAASALKMAETFQPDCAIVDLSLPEVTGYDLARSLRKALPTGRLLLIAYTGNGGEDVREKCRAAGFDAFLLKPGDPAVLEDLLRSI